MDELNRKIAEVLGYSVEPRHKPGVFKRYALIGPDGKDVVENYPLQATWNVAGNWSTDIAQALALVPKETRFVLRHMGGPRWDKLQWEAEIGSIDYEAPIEPADFYTTPAEAVCRAWLAWKAG